jgi:F-type H+-transporting ATPase subunit alpha
MKIHTQTFPGNEGEIISLSDGIVWLSGLANAMYGEIINFKFGISGLVLNLEENRVGAVVLGDYKKLQRGDKGIASGRLLEIGVGDAILGRVIDPLGNPLDEKGPIVVKENMQVEKIAPGIIDRKPIGVPLQTGIKAIDAMIPIGRGQRELISWGSSTGKTALALDTMISQKGPT